MNLAPRQLDLFGRSRAATPAKPQPQPQRSVIIPPAPPMPVAATPVPRPVAPPPVETGPLPVMPSRQETLARARVLASQLAEHLEGAVKVLLTVHDNRSTMLSFRRQPPVLKIRAHHMFLDAPPDVVRAMADYAGRGKRQAGTVIDDFIARRQERIAAFPRKPTPLEPRGECFDLQSLFDDVNAAHFAGKIDARIGWGRHTSKRRRKSIRLGVYDHKAKEIRIHPALDRPDVPRFFVEFIVFHEMLHQLFPSARDEGRHVHHPRAFRDRERRFPKYDAAMVWERAHLQELLRR